MIPRDLRLLVLHVSNRCDQACAHCSIWEQHGGRAKRELGLSERRDILREAHRLGARAVLFTGGEPLLCDHLEPLVRDARSLGLSVQIATNGLGLARTGSWLALADEVYVSIEGAKETHDAVRGPGAFARLGASISSVRDLTARPRLIGRSVISRRNAASVVETVDAARALGLDALSFLPVDVSSPAFGGDPSRRGSLRPGVDEVAALRLGIARLEKTGQTADFVLEDGPKLRAMADGFLSHAVAATPRCNAPEWSSVVEVDGGVRPCFFQPGVRPEAGPGLRTVRESAEYARALHGLGPGNPICATCVCPKYLPGVSSITARVAAVLSRIRPRREAPSA